MTKIKTLKPRLKASAHARLSVAKQGEEGRNARRGTPAERGYDAWWRKQSAAFRAAHAFCDYCWLDSVRCDARMVDHLYPHGIRFGSASEAQKALFRLREYWVPCCHDAHKSFKARMEAEGIEALDALALRLGKAPLVDPAMRRACVAALMR